MGLELIMMKGLPGSGKSTFAISHAKEHGFVRINKDDLRAMIGSYKFNKEQFILKMRDELITLAFEQGKNVIVDDTNFHPKHETRLRELCKVYSAKFTVNYVNTPLIDCLKNNLKRANSVAENVINNMYREWIRPTLRKAKNDGRTAIICDIDGTLANHNGRSPYDTEKCDKDTVYGDILDILYKYQRDDEVIFLSGRSDKYRAKTEEWLKKFGFEKNKLFMRKEGDFRKDYIVKQELYLGNIEGKYRVKFILDDRTQVVSMWRDLGLRCLQVADGDF